MTYHRICNKINTYELLAWASPQFVICLCEVGVVDVVKLQVVTLFCSVRLCSHFFIGGSWFIYIYEQWHFRLFETRETQSGRFYLLPKIHKVNNPGRPIVSANGNPTEKNLRIRRFPPSTSCRSVTLTLEGYHWLSFKMESMNLLPSILSSMDVMS